LVFCDVGHSPYMMFNDLSFIVWVISLIHR
jgi:hypothetical protein